MRTTECDTHLAFVNTCVLSDFLRQFWRKHGFMTPELGQRTSFTVGKLYTVKCVCIFHEVQWSILVFKARAL